MSIQSIENLTRDYAAARRELASRVDDLNELLRMHKRRRMAGIRNALAKAQEAKSALANAIKAEPEQFKKPRSIVVAGIKVGLQKSKGKIVILNAKKAIERLEKDHPKEAELCIKTEKKLINKALGNLDAKTLKGLGISVVAGRDGVLIAPQDDELDKLLDRILEEGDEEEAVA